MPKKSNVELAFDEQVNHLEKAQAGMVRAEFKTWYWNKRRIETIESLLDVPSEETDKKRKQLTDERHKLITENTALYSHINRALKGTFTQEDDLADFCFGK